MPGITGARPFWSALDSGAFFRYHAGMDEGVSPRERGPVFRNIPNALSALRIGFAAALFFAEPGGFPFVALYLAAGVSDALDGHVARRFGLVSRFGARLDSAADLALYAFIVVLLCRSFPSLVLRWLVGLVAVAALRFANLAYTAIRTGRPYFIHTLGNKASGLFVYALPLALGTAVETPAVAVTFLVAFLSALEELAINLTSKTVDLDRKGLFW